MGLPQRDAHAVLDVVVARYRPKVLTVGVAVTDLVFHVKQFPTRPEKYRAESADIVGGGGAANAAVAISRLDGLAWVAARTGDDQMGATIAADLRREGVRTDLVRTFEGRQSSFSSVLVDEMGERLIVNYRDTKLPTNANWLRELALDMPFDAMLADTRWPDGAAAVMAASQEKGVPGVLDAEAPVHEADEALGMASHIVFSAQGLRDFVGHSSADPADSDLGSMLSEADEALHAVVGVTDGADGVRWLEEGTLHHQPAPPLPAPLTDTLGAGDVWHGALALALAEGQALEPAMRFANAAATLKCVGATGRAGAPYREDVEEFLRSRST